jgi:ubiquinone/menaquinone biosynthesis C-methylase UbiE
VRTGRFYDYDARRYPLARFTAVDFSEVAIEVANSKLRGAGQSIEFLVHDAERLGLGSHTYDYIVSCECLEHVPHPDKMATEITRCLKPLGGFILSTENYFNGMILAWISSWLRNKPFNSGSGVQPHENFFLYWRVRQILESAGLKIVHMESSHFQWLLLPRVAPKKLCTEDFGKALLRRFFRPFGRHFTYQGFRPDIC